MARAWRILWVAQLAALTILAGACRSEPRMMRIVDSDVIDSLLAAAPVTLIHTESLPPEIWYPDKEVAVANDSLALPPLFSFTVARDSLYFADPIGNAILVSGLFGPLRRRVGRFGQGPLEFEFLSNILFNGEQFFTFEPARIQRLTKQLGYVSTHPPLDGVAAPLGYRPVVSKRTLYGMCSRGSANRVCPRESTGSMQELDSFLPSLGIEQPPMDLTVHLGASSNDEVIVASFSSLPYLFVFNAAHKHVHTLRFHGDVIRGHSREFPLSTPGIPGLGVKPLWGGVTVLESDMIAAWTQEQAYFIRVHNGEFELVTTVQFSRQPVSGDERMDSDLVRPHELEHHDGYIYVSVIRLPHILRYRADL